MRRFAFECRKAALFNGQRIISRGISSRGSSDAKDFVARNKPVVSKEGTSKVNSSDKVSSSLEADVTHSNNDKDDFAELGDKVFAEPASMKMDVVTNRHLNATLLGADMRVLSQTSSSCSAQQDLTLAAKSSQSCTAETDWRKSIQSGRSNAIVIKAMPPGISMFEVNEAALAFGEISCSSLKTSQDGRIHCHVYFKNPESKENAVASSLLNVKGHQLTIHNLHIPEQAKVRIHNISVDTNELAVYSVCLSVGSVVSLARVDQDAMDAIFNIEDAVTFDETVKRLNSVTVNDSKWSACVMPMEIQTASQEFDRNQFQLGSQLSAVLRGAKRRLQMQRIYLNDLESLHHAVAHLRNSPCHLVSGNLSTPTSAN